MSAPDNVDKRAALLASTALGLFGAGRLEDAARALREAIQLSPNNPQVRSAFQHIQQTQNAGSRVPELCKKLFEDASIESGEEAVKIIKSGGNLSKDQANSVLLAALQYEGDLKISAVAGKLLSAIVQTNTDGKAGFIVFLSSEDMRGKILEKILDLGVEATDTLTSLALEPKIWKADQQAAVLKSSFRYLMNQVNQSKPNERAIRPLSRLLALESKRVESLVSQSDFRKLLGLIHDGSNEEAKTSALLATAKYLESIDSEKALKLLGEFLTSRIASNNDEDMAVAFDVAAALFPVATSNLSALFQTEGFAESLVPSLRGRSSTVEVAAISLMSAACVDKACRDAVSKHCEEYLKAVATSKGEGSSAASLALAKLSRNVPETVPGQTPVVKSGGTDKEVEELADSFKTLLSSTSDISKQQSVEGLAYTSLTPSVKEKLAKDKATIHTLLTLLTPTTPPATLFGVLTTLDNITKYTKPLTEEQKKMAQLKNYANAQPQNKELEIPKLDKDAYVTKRCKALLDAGAVTGLVRLNKKISPTATALVSSILLSLSKIPVHRGVMAQQGAVRLLLQIYSAIPQAKEEESAHAPETPEKTLLLTTTHAFSRLLVSVNPTLAFSSTMSISSAIPPIIALIQAVHTSTADTRDLLPLFEALLALTNLASTTDAVRDAIIKKDFLMLEELMIYHNDMIQRAAVELVCNLMVSPETVALFSDGPRSGNRLQILLAIVNVDDVASRLAAGGALAMLTEWDAGVKAILAREGAVKRILDMCDDNDTGVVFRGVVIMRNLAVIGGKDGKEAVKNQGGLQAIEKVVRGAVSAEMKSALVEIVQVLAA